MSFSIALLALSALAQAPASQPAAATPERPAGVYAVFTIVQGTEPVGTIVARLFEKESPLTVANFVGLARGTKPWRDPKTKQLTKKPLYNGLTFHRVIPGFMIQGGDPLGTGTGGTEDIKDEFNPELKFDRPGLLGMANSPNRPNSGSCQFFITEKPTPHLDGKHAIFGEVIEGQDLVEKIARVPRNSDDKPNVPVIMKTVRIERYPRPVTPAKPSPAKAAKPKPSAPKPAAPAPAKK